MVFKRGLHASACGLHVCLVAYGLDTAAFGCTPPTMVRNSAPKMGTPCLKAWQPSTWLAQGSALHGLVPAGRAVGSIPTPGFKNVHG